MTVTKIKSIAPRFDASRDVVEQLEAASTDGTKIPYFVVHPKGMKLDGNSPTILYADGGFEVSETPSYSAMMGKLWLEQGGVFVLANIRGGGEFGPAWHEAGLKTKRQIIYDDFAAVAQDLIARKAKGEDITVEAEEPKAEVVDLMAALEASLKKRPRKKAAARTRSRSRRKSA